MKHLKRALSLLLVLAMLALTVVSCGNSSTSAEQGSTIAAHAADATTEATTEQPTETTRNPAASDLPEDLNYNGETVTVISRDRDWVRDEIWVENINGDVVNDAVFHRNSAVEERLGLKIVNSIISGNNYAVSDKVRTAVKAGSEEFDILANSVYSSIMYTSENIFHNLYNCEYLDLEKPYWAQGFNKAASIGSGQYMCTGAAALTLYRYMFVTFFNKDMLAEVTDVNLYEVVNQGKWTLDYHYELANQFYSDLDGDGQAGDNDRYGFVSTDLDYVDVYWSSCELPILTKDENNTYVYSVDLERMSAAVDKILKLWYNCKGSHIFPNASEAKDQLVGTRAISERRAVTTTLRLVSVEADEFRNMTDRYGIIPIPKMDESQNIYQTFLHDEFTAFGIVSTVNESRLQMMGAFLEAMAEESYKSLVPTYYELALKTKYVSDEESGQMLDMIYRSVYIDAGVLYTKTIDAHQQLRKIIQSQNNTVASTFKATAKVVAKTLTKLNEGLLAIQ